MGQAHSLGQGETRRALPTPVCCCVSGGRPSSGTLPPRGPVGISQSISSVEAGAHGGSRTRGPRAFPKSKQVCGENRMKSKVDQSVLPSHTWRGRTCHPEGQEHRAGEGGPRDIRGRLHGRQAALQHRWRGSTCRLCRQACKMLDLTVGLRPGLRLLQETQKVRDFHTQPWSLERDLAVQVPSRERLTCSTMWEWV